MATRHAHVSGRGTPGDTQPCNMTVCRTWLRHTPVSLPVWTKIGHLNSQFATSNLGQPTSTKPSIYAQPFQPISIPNHT
ncbi:hypothetical protein F383_30291 [Gossypium arboreum]|uniref:Uncharacterized protein n=1 Tax=Gossypium arboreum TaxID=29729 RepID=A0A0B0MVU1_GOSAR|nr:hypothetical protein F383_30291 [Gossypium arboreum]